FWILLSRRKPLRHPAQVCFQTSQNVTAQPAPAPELRAPKICFADVGGMEEAKEQIREVVEGRLNPDKYAAYGVVRNGILLYGPRGSGKTFLAEATAGEFKLNFHYVSPTKLMSMWVAESERNLRGAFARALRNRPALLFIDEMDGMGSMRQNLEGSGDPGGGGRAYNNMTIELMQSIDDARIETGFVLMAATNVIDGLDEALVRDGRFDVKVHVDLPGEATREKIFEAQLATKPWERFDLKEFARRTPGVSAAKIRSLVDQAAVYAAREGRMIEARDLEAAMEASGGKDRPLFQAVEWHDLIVDERVERELRTLIRLVDKPFAAQKMGLEPPMGVLLLGPPGTGKTMIARLIATQSRRSFLPITSAEITEPKAVSRVFSRARENSPSLIFLDEMDSLLPANPGYLNQYYVQIVEQFLIEISNLQPENNVFLVGTTNHPENIDPRILRGGRFSDKIEIGVPGPSETRRLLSKYLAGIELDPKTTLEYLSQWFCEITPADLEAMVSTAKRYAFERSGDDRLVPLNLDDFDRAAGRVMGQAPPLPSIPS
ncbi:MAG: AAA family ATPase, partial [Terriglobia bacterium]